MQTQNLHNKPNLRTKGKRRGIRTGNTIKFDIVSFNESKNHQFTFDIHQTNENLNSKRIIKHYSYTPSLPQSLDKDKRWEKLEELKKNPEYLVVEYPSFHRTKTTKWENKYKFKQHETKNENKFIVVKNRKGRSIKKIENKKLTEEKKTFSDAKFVIEIQRPTKKGIDPVFRRDTAEYLSDYEDYCPSGFEKNHRKKKRTKRKKECTIE
eukprot:gene474-6884_t